MILSKHIYFILLLNICFFFFSVVGYTQVDSLKYVQKINNVVGSLLGSPLDNGDNFGQSIEVIGDVDHDGIDDIAVGAPTDDDGGIDKGAIYILMLNADGTVKDQQKISELEGNAPTFYMGHINFGSAIAALGDLNGDGNVDIAVGGRRCDDDGVNTTQGAVFILFLSDSGTVLEYQKISDNQGGGPGTLDSGDFFGAGLSNIGDLNDDGLPEIAITALKDDDGGTDIGAVYIGFLDYNGTLKNIQKISALSGGFGGILTTGDSFISVSGMGDINNDGIEDIVIGNPKDDDGGTDRGAVWVCFMNSDGTVASEQKISDTLGSFAGTLNDGDFFGIVLGIDDLDSDGVHELIVSAVNDDDGGTDEGALWVLYLDTDGTVKNYDKISTTDLLLSTEVNGGDKFGISISYFGDRNNDGKIDILVGAPSAIDGGGIVTGEVYVVHVEGDTTYPHKTYHQTTPFINSIVKHSAATSPLDVELGASDSYGVSSSGIGDLDGDGVEDLVVGAQSDDDGGGNKGAIYVNFMNLDGTIKNQQKISDTRGGFNGSLYSGGGFGSGVAGIGDINNDGVEDIAVGASTGDDGGTNRGEIWILFMTDSGYVKSEQKISDTAGNFTGILDDQDYFGEHLTGVGDINGDGIPDLIAGTPNDGDGYSIAGAVWILFLDTNGTVKSHQKISATEGGLSATLAVADYFGADVTSLGDIDNDGVPDIAVGARGDDDGETAAGAIYIIYLTDSGTVKSETKVSKLFGDFDAYLETAGYFGWGLEGRYDLDYDGINDIVAAAPYIDNGGTNRGGVWVLYMNKDATVKSYRTISGLSNYMLGELDDDDRFGMSISILNYSNENNFVTICVGASQDDDIYSNSGAVYILEIDLSVLQDYSNNVFIDTRSFSDSIPFDVEIEDSTYSFITGGIEALLIIDTTNIDTAIISVAGTSNYEALNLLFDVDGKTISNVRIITDSLGSGDTLSLDSSLYTISSNGQLLTLYQNDTNEISTDSLLYGFVLQNGLGFSPDGDGDYDELEISGLESIYYFNLTIKDLASTIVFYTQDKNDFWNGKYMGTGSLMNKGSYQYILNVNGETIEGQILMDY